MKILVIGDIHVDVDYYAKQVERIDWGEETEVLKYQWFPKDKKEFQEVALEIEKNGAENIPYPEEIDLEIETADAIFTHFCPVNTKLIESAPKLKIIACCRGGLEHISPLAAKKGIKVINVIRNAEPVADFTLGLILSELRNISRSYSLMKQGLWEKSFKNSEYTTCISSLKVGLIGFGAIGQFVAKQLVSLGADVLVNDSFLAEKDILEKNNDVQVVSLDELLRESDVISVHVRFEKGQPPIINHESFKKMKKNCIFVNTSRAYAVDKEALIEALENEVISGAALDVFWDEPIEKDDPLLKLDNVTLTPHLAGDTAQAIPQSPKMLIDRIIERKLY